MINSGIQLLFFSVFAIIFPDLYCTVSIFKILIDYKWRPHPNLRMSVTAAPESHHLATKVSEIVQKPTHPKDLAIVTMTRHRYRIETLKNWNTGRPKVITLVELWRPQATCPTRLHRKIAQRLPSKKHQLVTTSPSISMKENLLIIMAARFVAWKGFLLKWHAVMDADLTAKKNLRIARKISTQISTYIVTTVLKKSTSTKKV